MTETPIHVFFGTNNRHATLHTAPKYSGRTEPVQQYPACRDLRTSRKEPSSFPQKTFPVACGDSPAGRAGLTYDYSAGFDGTLRFLSFSLPAPAWNPSKTSRHLPASQRVKPKKGLLRLILIPKQPMPAHPIEK